MGGCDVAAPPAAEGATPVAGGESIITAAPHLLQKRVPGVILAPQELQNAMDHLDWSDNESNKETLGASIPQIDWNRAGWDLAPQPSRIVRHGESE